MSAIEPSWDEVLADVEADVDRTEQLMRAMNVPPSGPARSVLSPAELMLPSKGPRLPDLATMPRVPGQLADRIQTLRARIGELGRELALALDEVGAALAAPVPVAPAPPVVAPPRPLFVDRSA